MNDTTITLKFLLDCKDLDEAMTKISFEQGLKILDELVSTVESGALPLDKAILSYERGAVIIEHLRRLLSGAEEKLKILQKNK